MNKLVFVAGSPLEADLLAAYLESQNIRTYLEHYTTASLLPVGGDLSVKILVHSAQYSRAVALIELYVQREREDS
jgi:hypothetical protein